MDTNQKNPLDQDFNSKSLLKFTLPPICLMMFSSLYSVVDGLFVANFVGEFAFASLNLVFPWSSFIIAIGLLFGTGGCAILSRTMGEGNLEKAREHLSFLTIVTVLVGLLLTGIGMGFAEDLVRFFGATETLQADCVSYVQYLSAFAVASLLQFISQMFFLAEGKPNLGFGVGVLGGVVNMILDYVFIVLFAWGVKGAALATGIGYCVPAFCFLLYFSRHKNPRLFFAKPRWDGTVLLETLVNGSSEMVSNLAGTITTFLFNRTILIYAGEAGVVAVGVLIYAQFLFQSAFLGYAQGVSPIVGYAYGAKRHARMLSVIRYSLYINVFASVGVYLLLLCSTSGVVSIFLDGNSEAFPLTETALRLFALSFLPQGINIFASALFTACADGKTSAGLSFLRTCFFIVLFVQIVPLWFGVYGVWLSVPFAEAVSLPVSLCCIHQLQKKLKQAEMAQKDLENGFGCGMR